MQLLAWGAAVSLEPGRQDAVGRGRTEGGFSGDQERVFVAQ